MHKSLAKIFGLLTLGVILGAAQAQVNVTTFHNDNARTGQNLQETMLNTSNVNVARFGKLFERSVDSNIWAQPLYLSGVNIPGKGMRNVVYVETEVGQLYAFDADNASETAPLWRRDLAPNDYYDSLSTPVIDRSRNTIYCIVRHGIRDGDTNPSNDNVWFTFHGLDITTGLDKFPERRVEGSVAGVGKGSANGRLGFRANTQKQRPGLLLFNGAIYAAFGGGIYEYEADATWNGWIFGFDGNNGAIKSIYAAAPDRNGAGIWQAANALSSDGTSIYAATGNGGNNPLSTTSDQGGRDYGNSIIRLTPNSTASALNVNDFWTPFNFQYMEVADQDLGSSGLLVIPGTNLLMTGDKLGRLYVLDRTNLGKFTTGRNAIVQDFGGWRGHLHGGPIYWNSPNLGPLVYGWAEHDYLRAFKVLGNQGLQTDPAMKSLIQVPPGMPGGMLSISANGSQAGTGILWAAAPHIGDANLGIVPGVLRAFDATDLTKELWNSELIPSRDDVGFFAKFAPPTVANGKVYAPSFYNPSNYQGAKLLVYGLLPAAPKPAAPSNLQATGQPSKVDLTWNATANATAYTLKRATSASGPFRTIEQNLLTNSFEDWNVINGTNYFYLVTASNAGGESGNSNVASATPFAPVSGSVISVNFVGGSATNNNIARMEAAEVAGVVPASNWNSAYGGGGYQTDLRANGGAQTSANVLWDCAGTYSTSLPDTPGNNRMMKGYLSNSNTGQVQVTVTGLPANFLSSGYDVYAYVDGNNPTSTRSGTFSIGNESHHITDSQNRDFEGRFFPPGVADVGNYVVFKDLNSTSFVLTGVRAEATDGVQRAPLNGIQIVAHQTEAVAPAAPSNLRAFAGNGLVSLDWNAVANADSYLVRRSTTSGAPYSIIASDVTDTSFVDQSATNGTKYYYVVHGVKSGQNSDKSNEVSATPMGNLSDRSINLNFAGGNTTLMASGETAGVAGITSANWNNLRYANGGAGDVSDSAGAHTTADVVWNSDVVGDLPIADVAGNNRMMRGYLTPENNSATINVYHLPASITANGYDIYVYADNYNGGERTGNYNVGNTGITLTDAANANFAGNFVQANNGTGNVIKFSGLTDATFTLTSIAGATADGAKGAPINGIQIVAKGNSGPQVVSVAPNSGASTVGQERIFTAIYRDSNGANDLAHARLTINVNRENNACISGFYNLADNKLYLFNNLGTTLLGGFRPGSNNTIESGKGILNCANTTVTKTGDTLTIRWAITPKSTFTGQKNLWAYTRDLSGANSGWVDAGDWTINAGINSAPKTGSVSPASATSAVGSIQYFTATYSDTDGAGDIKDARILINTTTDGNGSIKAYYHQASNKLYLFDNTGQILKGGFAPGSSNLIANSQGNLDCAKTTVTQNGNTLTIKWAITPKVGFEGVKKVYLSVRDNADASDGYNQVGTWTINASPSAAPAEAPASSKRTSRVFLENSNEANPSA